MFLPVFLVVVFWPLLVLCRSAKTIEIVPDASPSFRLDSPKGVNNCNLDCRDKKIDYHCGTDGRTYDTSCDLLNANCKNHDIKLGYKGRCDATKPIPPSSCPKTWTCLGRYEPVCGTDDKTYDNECYLVIANCRDTSIGFKHYGACGKCEQTCSHVPTQYVCASDNFIYRNLCELRNAGCEKRVIQVTCPHTGPVKKKCSEVCTLNYDPKCGSNGKSYINQCHLDLNICRDPSIHLAHDGACVLVEPVEPAVTKCTPCSGSEPEDYICGSDGVSYPSACAFNYALCDQKCPTTLRFKNTGKCQCYEDCTLDKDDPVCGSDGVTYDTTCAFRVASCTDQTVKLQSSGACEVL